MDMSLKFKTIYDVISLMIIVFMIYIVYSRDIFFIVGMFVSLFLHYVIKKLTKDLYPNIFLRPSGACNCNSLNSGGIVDDKPGFPSGHMTTTSFFLNYLFFSQKYRSPLIFLKYNFFNLFMGYSRFKKKCHNLPQIIAGYILGLSGAFVFDKLKKTINKK
jgi:membrane-associated phospholipid phosphatase